MNRLGNEDFLSIKNYGFIRKQKTNKRGAAQYEKSQGCLSWLLFKDITEVLISSKSFSCFERNLQP